MARFRGLLDRFLRMCLSLGRISSRFGGAEYIGLTVGCQKIWRICESGFRCSLPLAVWRRHPCLWWCGHFFLPIWGGAGIPACLHGGGAGIPACSRRGGSFPFVVILSLRRISPSSGPSSKDSI